MEYEILQVNDNQTARVRMTIGTNILDQDFPLGSSQQELTDAIMQGLAVFNAEIIAQSVTQQLPYQPVLNDPVTVDPLSLPQEDAVTEG